MEFKPNFQSFDPDWWPQLSGVWRHPAQALLVTAPPRLGVENLARSLAAAMLCPSPGPDHQPCGACPSCRWVLQNQHPDLRLIVPAQLAEGLGVTGEGDPVAEGAGQDEEEKAGAASREIRIDQIRGLADFSALSAHRSGLRLVVIGPVENLNYAAANALLKGLEEPNPGLRFILFGERSQGIPATILSRCRRLPLISRPERRREAMLDGQEALSWLMPLLASGQVQPSAWADQAGKSAPAPVIDLLLLWLSDLLRLSQSADPLYFSSPQLSRRAQPRSEQDLQRMSLALGALQDLARMAHHPLNPKLFFEQIFETLRKGMPLA